ncbi:MAG TPA: class I SAM-dependent methyltransferase [Acidimicrobiia bacterium]|nr:class I SAM-dependent methyltransferase [Acidimicrobiia bacterium]
MTNSWVDADRAADYLSRADTLPHRREGEGVLVRDLEGTLPGRVLDLGCGDGRLTALLLAAFPASTAVCVDVSPTMLDAARARFDGDPRVTVVVHDLAEPFPATAPFHEPFAAVVSSLAVHHVADVRKRALYAEMADRLIPGGVLANLDVVESPTRSLHERWRDEMGARDDPTDLLADLNAQLDWLRAAGLDDVDCIWKWRSLALMRGERPSR